MAIAEAKEKTDHPAGKGRLNVMHMTDVTGRGGAEKVLVDLAIRLDKSRYNVSACATRSAGNYQSLLDKAGVPTYILGRRTLRDIYKMVGLVRLLRRQRIHILHTHLFGSNTWGRLLGRLAGVPIIITHEHWSTKAQREIWVDRLLYRLSDRIMVSSEENKRVVMATEHIPARYISVIYNGVDIEHFNTRGDKAGVRAEFGVPPETVLVGYVGRLTPEKGGQDLLVRAVARHRQEGKIVRLLVVGDGPLRQGLETLAAELAEPVIFAGLRSDVARLLSAMDIFVLPSLHEAFPVAALEAMASRLPVIATVVGGNPELVQDGVNGLLVPPGDEDALYNALGRLIEDRALADRLAEEAQMRVRSHFTLGDLAHSVEEIYEELAKQKQIGVLKR